jgi:hypothetical protein
MARQKPTDEIEALRRQQTELQARLKAAEQRQKKQHLEENNRRKILLGTILLDFIKANPNAELTTTIATLVANKKLRPDDRNLLSPLFSTTHEATPETKKSGPGNNAGAA